MAFTIQIGRTTKAKNSTKISPLSNSVQVLLKDTTSVVNPTFQLRMGVHGAPSSIAELSQFNYCYCEKFKRYYFIIDIQAETATVANIFCECDVLATFRADILATPCFAMYSQSKKNVFIEDPRLPMYGISKAYTLKLPISFMSLAGCFVITAATPGGNGKNGPTPALVVSEGNLGEIANKLYGTDWWESIKNDLYHPNEALVACMWTPCDPGQVATGAYVPIKVGKYELGGGIEAKRNISEMVLLEIPTPNGDYRMFEPYSEYFAWLPGVGTVQLPMKRLVDKDLPHDSDTVISVPCHVTVSPTTGDITYVFTRNQGSGGTILGNPPVMTCKGNIGVEIPISAVVGRFGSVLQSAGGGIGSAVMAAAGIATANPIVFAGGAAGVAGAVIGGTIQSSQFNTTTAGSVGGWAVKDDLNLFIETVSIGYSVSDNPWEVASTIGCPLFMHGTIGEFSGFLKCVGAHVKTWGTAREHDIIASYVNSTTSNGGILVE